MKHIQAFRKILVIIIFTAFSLTNSIAQQNSFSILATGNINQAEINYILLNKWENISEQPETIAPLILGNFYSLKEKQINDDLFWRDSSPLLVVPGETEWADGRISGKDLLNKINNDLKKEYGKAFHMPEAGCPGPKTVVLNDYLIVILLDTHWWVHKHDRKFKKCDIETSSDILIQIEDTIRKHYGSKHVVIAGHNSLISYGNSGGYFSFKQKILEAPYTYFRKIHGSIKDNHHPDFKGFRDAMLSILEKYPDIIYMSAGDNNLQYFLSGSTHHIVSGSMENAEYVNNDIPEFASTQNGFVQLNFTDTGASEIVFHGINGELFRKEVYQKTLISSQDTFIVHWPDSIIVKASDKYNLSKTTKFWLGENYRDIWDTPIKVKVFDISNQNGGLEVIKRGGGFQTKSLRLEDKNGHQYVLRSVDKKVDSVLPVEFRSSFVLDIVQDQISTSNPYGAVVVAELADAAGVFHTNPQIVYVPDDPRFGIYRQDVADQLFLFEERPDGNWKDLASFGNSEDIISTEDMIENLQNDNDCKVDYGAYLRARLFDTIINDWDRHEDQWRWASFTDDGITSYKPIPRDRDQAFFNLGGVLGWIATWEWLPRSYQTFNGYTENMPDLAYNARVLDRLLMPYNEWEDWKLQVDFLKTHLTDNKIDESLLKFPKAVQPLISAETSRILKERRDNLKVMARQLYEFLTKEVSVVGTNKKNLFVIDIPDDTTMQIVGYHINKKSKIEREYYTRIFSASETDKIYLYGLGDEDKFLITGLPKNKIALNIIGGSGKDNIYYNGVNTPRFITIYDKKNTVISKNLKNKTKYSVDKNELEYDRTAFKYNNAYPGIFMGFNKDDGIFLGGSFSNNIYSRYTSQHYKLRGNYAFLTDAYNFRFDYLKSYPLRNSNLNLNIDMKSPNYVENYFGIGNETKLNKNMLEDDYYRIRTQEYSVQTDYKLFLDKMNYNSTNFGLFYKYTKIEKTIERFISDFTINDLSIQSLEPKSYIGVLFKYDFNTISKEELKSEDIFIGSKIFPTGGYQVSTSIAYFKGISGEAPDFVKLSGNALSYLSFSKRPTFVYAFKIGAETNIGDYPFNEAAKLGQTENLRGFRKTRFYGDTAVYLNSEIRTRVKQFNTYILSGTAGIFIFDDLGRVWLKSEDSSLWHNGVGIGIWASIFDMTLISLSYSKSPEDNLFDLSLNFDF